MSEPAITLTSNQQLALVAWSGTYEDFDVLFVYGGGALCFAAAQLARFL